MPKIEVSADGGFLLNGKPKQKAYDILDSGDVSDPTITMYELGNERRIIAQAPLSEWTDAADGSFASLAAFHTYLLTTVGFFLNTSGGGGSVAWGDITGNINNQTDLPFTVEETKVVFDRSIETPNDSVGISTSLKLSSSNELLKLVKPLTDGLSYIPEVRIIGKTSDGLCYVDPYKEFSKTDPEGQVQPIIDRTLGSTPFVDSITGVTKYYNFVTIPSAIGDIISYNWFLRSSTGFTNGYIRSFKGFASDPNDNTFLWSTATPNDIKRNTGQPSGGGNNLINKDADIINDIQVPLGEAFHQIDGETLTFLLVCENDYIVEAGEIEFPPLSGNFFDYPYILADGTKWKWSRVPAQLEGIVTPHGVVDGKDGDYYMYKDGRNTTKYIFKNNVDGNNSWYRESNPIIQSGDPSDIEQSINMNEGEAFVVLDIIPETDVGTFVLSVDNNSMPNGGTCDLWVTIFNRDGDTVLKEETIVITDTIEDEPIEIDFSSLFESFIGQGVMICVVCNNYSSGGVVTFKKIRSKGVNQDNIIFKKSNVFNAPSTYDFTTGRQTTNDVIFWTGYRK